MEFRTYKVRQGQYSGIVNSTITIPDGLKLITGGPNDVGHFKHDGLRHYIGIMKGTIDEVHEGWNILHGDVKECGEYVFITINDISFHEEYPYLITADELNSEFDLSKYFIVTWSSYLKLMNMKKIVRVNSEFDLDVLEVTNMDYAGYTPMLSLNPDKEELSKILNRHFSFSDYAPMPYKVTEGKIAQDYWNTLVSNVTTKFGIPFYGDTVDIDYCHKLFEEGKYAELADYIIMKRASYLPKNN